MTGQTLDPETKKMLLTVQKNEITEYRIYRKLAQSVKDRKNKEVLEQIASEELKHFGIGKKYSQEEVKPSKWNIWKYHLISKIFGLTFAMKHMENGERDAQREYKKLTEIFSKTKEILEEEARERTHQSD